MKNWSFSHDSLIGCVAANIILLMIQLSAIKHAVGSIAVANSLLTCMEVNATISCHRHLLCGLMRKMSVSQLTLELEVPAS